MMTEAFKFIHASDFHLDDQMEGLSELPSHLKSVIANAPYTAAKRIFDLAITESADFVLLSGDLIDMDQGGCRPAAFLLSQFERLAEKNIAIYWCGGEVDYPDRWPAAIDLPKNVKTFSSSIVVETVHERRGKPLATIVASGFDSRRRTTSEFIVDQSAPYPIVLTHGQLDPVALAAKNIRYWALGGNHKSSVMEKAPAIVGFSGSPQSRRPGETGSHGCHVVRVEGTGATRTQFVEVDLVRWLPQKMGIAESASLDELKNLFTERALKLVSDHAEHTLFVTWHLSTSGAFNPKLRQQRQRDEIIQWLRDEFGRSEQGLWSVDFSIDPPAALPAGWYEEDTILGDYLRALGRYQSDESLSLTLHEFLPKSVDNEAATEIVRLSTEQRTAVLTDAALLGVEYLAAHRDVA
jgi:DNA repair exonuclease SbcCD nuclease subunit